MILWCWVLIVYGWFVCVSLLYLFLHLARRWGMTWGFPTLQRTEIWRRRLQSTCWWCPHFSCCPSQPAGFHWWSSMCIWPTTKESLPDRGWPRWEWEWPCISQQLALACAYICVWECACVCVAHLWTSGKMHLGLHLFSKNVYTVTC